MNFIIRLLIGAILFITCCCSQASDNEQIKVPILVYHKFGPTAKDLMTITPEVLEAQLQWLKDNGYTVIPLKTLVHYLQGTAPPPSPKSVVITVDDGHKSFYTYMAPLIRKYNIPVTLFIYPTAISNSDERHITWVELRELQQTGLFDIQSHTYWHPNFKQEKKKLSPEDYKIFVNSQLKKSKEVLEQKLGTKVDYLAWPYGIYDDELEKWAQENGYTAAFTIVRKHASKSYPLIRQPRYLLLNSDGTDNFAAIVKGNEDRKHP